MSLVSKISIFLSFIILSLHYLFESVLTNLNLCLPIENLDLLFIIFYLIVIADIFLQNYKKAKKDRYSKELNSVLISQSQNPLFYDGKLNHSARELTKQVATTIKADRCSIWVYNKDKTSIICQQLYDSHKEFWSQDMELFEKDFKPYFEALKKDPIIIANDAHKHTATECFSELYLKPLGINSMLDVPIIFKGEIVGVICIESFKERKWDKVEVNFARLLSSLYSFSLAVKEINFQKAKMFEMDKFINDAALVSKADKFGKITYVNQKFIEVSGYSLKEVLGKDHKIVNSGTHPPEMWSDMYKTVIEDRKIWNKVITNKSKNGNLYHVDTFIKGEFDPDTNEFLGYVSIRQDVTKIIESMHEIDKKNTYLEHAAKILRHDMHSGINTYIPRGITALERRLSDDTIKQLKLESPLKMLKEGLKHTQKIYRGVFEFTNLVKKDILLTKSESNIKIILEDFLSSTSYKSQVLLDENLPNIPVNESLFCTAIDNLIRNGLKYNDSSSKIVKVYYENINGDEFICVEDNGRGITQKEFEHLSKPYVRKENQKESGSGLGLNICKAILEEHGFEITAEKLESGTKLKIKII